jgi:hypothetical protein
MQLKSGFLFLAAAAVIDVAKADFMVYTVPPIPTDAIPSFTDPVDVGPLALVLLALLTDYGVGHELDTKCVPERYDRI